MPWHPAYTWPSLHGISSQWSSSCRSVDRPRSNFRVSLTTQKCYQLIVDRLRGPCIDRVTIVNAGRHESMHKGCRRSIVECSPDATKFVKPIEAAQVLEMCFSRLKSDKMVTPRMCTWPLAVTVSEPSSTATHEMLCLEPALSNSVWAGFICKRFSVIRRSMSATQCPRCKMVDAVLWCWQWTYTSENHHRMHGTLHCVESTASAGSTVWRTNNRGPRTEHSGTEHKTQTTEDITPSSKIRKDLSIKYDENQAKSTPRRPNWRSRRCKSNCWSAVSKAAVTVKQTESWYLSKNNVYISQRNVKRVWRRRVNDALFAICCSNARDFLLCKNPPGEILCMHSMHYIFSGETFSGEGVL